MPETNEQKTSGSDAEHTPAFARSHTWGAGGSFVFDSATGERLTEAEWAQRQAVARAAANGTATTPSTTKTSKGA